MFERAIFRSFCRDLRRILFASVMCFVFGIGNAWSATKFSVTTTNLSAGATFTFTLSANGKFTVDCGTDGVLTSSANDVTGPTNNVYRITRTNTNNATYTCTYANSGGVKTISFDGTVRGYSTSINVPTIKFTTPQFVAAISGDLSQIFSEAASSGSDIPRFYGTFEGCSNLVSIPGTLFSQYTKTGQYMFRETFKNCTGLGTSSDPNVVPIPDELFSGIGDFYTSIPQAGFTNTFEGCTGLQEIPEDLFLGIRNHASAARHTFFGTFSGCTGLTSIPGALFSGITTGAQSLFLSTFSGCTGLTSIPGALFSGITTGAESMFMSTFSGCTGLTSIPGTLFSGITTGAESMFSSTFSGCTGLRFLPDNLFANITSSANSMFHETFKNCSGLNGNGNSTLNFVPPTLFNGLIDSVNTPPQIPSNASSMMLDVFSGTNSLRTQCPADYYQYITGYESYWNSKVSCLECPNNQHSLAGSTQETDCGYSVTYSCGNASGSASVDNTYHHINTSVTTLQSATHCSPSSGQQFSGWDCGGQNNNVSPGGTFTITADTTCTAKWDCASGYVSDGNGNCVSNTPITYTVTYNNVLNSDTWNGNNPPTYTAGTSVTIGTPSRPNYVFQGWCKDTDNCQNPVNTYVIAAADTGNLVLYAQWDCASGYYLNNNQCVRNYPFTLTTTSLSSGDTFQFNISAAGTFYVDCGTDGTLSGDGSAANATVSGDTITKSNTTNYTYICTYSTGGTKTIRFGGSATGYRNDSTAAIRFNISGTEADTNVKKISSISGSLGQIFGTITNPTTGVGQPKFAYTFYSASNMTGTSIADPNNSGMNYALPPTLFDGIYGSPAPSMFGWTFYGCSGLTGSIPSGLFGNLSGSPEQSMFWSTFQSCSGLTGSIPSGLFGNLSGSPAPSMFYATFSGCSGLTGSIPSGLFGNLSGSPEQSMFGYTFSNCSGLTGSIPSGLFGNLSGSPAPSMFVATFSHCSGLTGSIPSGLFGNLSGSPEQSMFEVTFSGCSGLTGSIPSGLFGNLSGLPAPSMFRATFSGCSGLTGSIPSGLFGNLSGSPAHSMFYATFQSCRGLTGSIPSGLFGNLSGSPEPNMFGWTFSGCSGLTGSIPSGLFGNLSGSPAPSMFYATFQNCSGLTGSIPSGLFGNLSGSPAQSMFGYTFSNCSGLTGFGDKTYVPGDFLANINTNTSVTNQATNMFYGTQLDIPCPAGTYDVTRTQFNDASRPWCNECPSGTTSPAGSTDVSQCVSNTPVMTYTVTYHSGNCNPNNRTNYYASTYSFTDPVHPSSGGTYSVLSPSNTTLQGIVTYPGYEGVGPGVGGDCYNFRGWKDSNISGTQRYDYSSCTGNANGTCTPQITNVNDNVDLYAYCNWYNYTVNYYDCEENFISTDTLYYGDPFMVPSGNTITGYTFNGWALKEMPGAIEIGSTFSSNLCMHGGTAIFNLAAQCTPIDYTVTYNNVLNSDTWTGSHSPIYTYGTSVTIGTPSRPNYVFQGWCKDTDNCQNPVSQYVIAATDTGNLVLYAQWDCANGYQMVNGQCVPGYTITLDCGEVNCDQSAVPSTLYTIYGQGAYLDAARTQFMTTSSNPVVLPTKNPYVVSYNTNAPINSKTNQPYSVPAVSSSSVTFLCEGFGIPSHRWISPSGNDTVHGYITAFGTSTAANATENITMSAVWSISEPAIQAGPSLYGYNFNGWYDNAAGTGESINYIYTSTPSTLYAKWTPITYNINYVLNDGTYGANHPVTATYNTEFNVSNPTRAGYTFTGWDITVMTNDTHYIGNNTVSATSASGVTETSFMNLRSVSGAVTFTATWSSNSYNITYNNVNDNTDVWVGNHPATYAAGSSLTIGTPSRTNYVFQGWCKDTDNCQNPVNTYVIAATDTGNLVLYAQWDCATNYEWNNGACVPIQYTITYYDSDCTTVLTGLSPSTYTVDQSVTLAQPPAAPTGYTNHGWCDNCGTCGINSSIIGWSAFGRTGAQTIYLNPRTPNEYSITYDANGHGFYTSSAQSNVFGPGASNGGGTYNATWSTKSLSDAHISASTGYTFCGWSENSSDTCGSNTILTANASQGTWTRTSNLKLYAIYSANTYTITYNNVNNATWGSGENHPGTYTYGTSVTIGTPSWTSYSFLGWCVGGDDCPSPVSPYVIAATDTGNLVLYAQWGCANGYHMVNGVCVNTYTLTYVANAPSGATVTGMPSTNPVTVTAGTTYELATVPSATGYPCQGWICVDANGNVLQQTISTFGGQRIEMPSSNVTCSADWGANTVIDLGWDTNGGTGSVSQFSTTCNYGTGTISLGPNPTKSGYKFNGWLVTNWQCDLSGIDVSINGTSSNSSYTGTVNGTWSVTFPYGELSGLTKCNESHSPNGGETNCSATGTQAQIDSSCRYCWCKLTTFTENGAQCNVESVTSWQYYGYFTGSCIQSCPTFCAMYVKNNSGNFRSKILTTQ